VENPDYAAFAAQVIRAHGWRVADGGVEDLADLLDLASAERGGSSANVRPTAARCVPHPAVPCSRGLGSGEHFRRVLERQAVRLGNGSGHQVARERGQPLCEDRIGGGGADHAVSGVG
jgi:hypothetical protein